MGWTLALAFGATVLVLLWRLRRPRRDTAAAASRPLDTYRIYGRVEVRNDCGGPSEAVPNQLSVHAVLSDGRRKEIGTRTAVTLQPGPAGVQDGPDQVGTYALEVEWTGSRPPAYWDPPRAKRLDGSDVCEGLGCDRATRCVNLAGRPRRIELTGAQMEFTVRVACICVPQ